MNVRRFLLLATFVLLCYVAPSIAADAAALSGTWNVTVTMDSENHHARMMLRLDNGVLTGKVQGGENNREFELKTLKLDGDTLTFSVNTGEQIANFTVKVDGDKLEGTVKVAEQTGTFKGTKQS